MPLSQNLLDYPILVFVLSFAGLWAASRLGAFISARQHSLTGEGDHQDYDLLLASTLTLLGLIIGFAFSMAVSRYDQRKNYEEAEANAIGTEYLRLDLLPSSDVQRMRRLLISYLEQRVLYYQERSTNELRQVDERTSQLQSQMWSSVAMPSTAQPSAVTALVVSGMNDVLNSQGYTLAAWKNRVPSAAWTLLLTIAIFCNLLVGYGARRTSSFHFLILPIALSISLYLIADIDSPRGGIIHVHPQNLESLLVSLHSG
jgi:hypothetical protein